MSFVAGFPLVGFSGSRSVVPVAALSAVADRVSGSVVVGCASGVDLWVRGRFPGARVFSVAAVSSAVPFRARLAGRSAALVRFLVAGGGCLVAFPSGPVPAGVRPGPVWSGGGSGSWASVALAVGLGVPVLLWLPVGSVPPPWGFSGLGAGWFVARPAVQLGLFG